MAKITIIAVDDDGEAVVIKANDKFVQGTTEAGMGPTILVAVARLEAAFRRELDEYKAEQARLVDRLQAMNDGPLGNLMRHIASMVNTPPAFVNDGEFEAEKHDDDAEYDPEGGPFTDTEPVDGPLDGSGEPVTIVVEDLSGLQRRVVDENVKNFGDHVPSGHVPLLDIEDEVAQDTEYDDPEGELAHQS